jgi:uncharacterized protein
LERLQNKTHAWVIAWVDSILKIPTLIVAAGLIGVFFALTYTANNIGVYTDTAAMLSEDLPFRQSYEAYRSEFPQLVDMLLVVVDAPNPEAADAATLDLATHLQQKPELFADIFAPGDNAYFKRMALLYQDEATLDELAAQLDTTRPLLGALSESPYLASLATMISGILSAPTPAVGIDPGRLTAELDRALAADLAAQPYDVSWQRILSTAPEDGTARRYLFAKPILDFTEPLAAEAAIAHIRLQTNTLSERYGAKIRITGDAALAYEELTIALGSAKLTGILAFIMVTGVLLIGLRSGWLALACMINLLVGLCMTAAFATVAVGNLNLISLAFAVLYIGLGADYAIHLTLRYRERLIAGDTQLDAIRQATIRMAGPLLLCTLTTASGFFAFLPTHFTGVSELGLIAGTGMFINLALSLTMLPGLLALLPAPKVSINQVQPIQTTTEATYKWRLAIRTVAIALGIAAIVFLPRLEFDFDALNLRPATAESVATLRNLMSNDESPPFSITVLAGDRAAARTLQLQLRALPTVSDVHMIEDLVPVDTEHKRATIAHIDAALGPILRQTSVRPPPTTNTTIDTLRSLKQQLTDNDPPFSKLTNHLDQFLQQIENLDELDRTKRLTQLESRWLGQLRPNLNQLGHALAPPNVSVKDLPASLRRRWVSADETLRIAVYPREDISDREALRHFVRTVQTIAPNATDEPVLNVEAGEAIVAAFRQAFTLSIAVIAVLLMVLIRRLSSVLLIMTPLLLAGLLTMGVMGLFNIPFNFANVIALPLLFGIGVDNGVHIVQRATEQGGTTDPMRTSTSRGVLLSMLTTICGFGNLLISPHPGTASIGLVLTIGIAITLFCTLVVLPALLPATARLNTP